MTRPSAASLVASLAARRALAAAKAALKEGAALAEVLEREAVQAHGHLPALLAALPQWGPTRVRRALERTEDALGARTHRLWTRHVGELTNREIDAVLKRVDP